MIATVVSALIALLAAPHSFAATPVAAATHLFSPETTRYTILRVNVAGSYATVLTRGFRIEGAPENAPILVEHFSFGWQALESLDFQCRLDAHRISDADKRRLMAGMPKPQNDRPCRPSGGDRHDEGAQADVDAIREQMNGLVPSVTIVGNYAIGEWYGGGGGQQLYRHQAGRWVRMAGGGGAMGTDEMIAYHVPKSAWCKLGVYNAKCTRS
jgi:hypothetical protein